MSIINIIATVSLALPANTAKQVSSSVAMLMCFVCKRCLQWADLERDNTFAVRISLLLRK